MNDWHIRKLVGTDCWECVLSVDGYAATTNQKLPSAEVMLCLLPTHIAFNNRTIRGRIEGIKKVWKKDWPEMVDIYSRDGMDELIRALEEVRDALWDEAGEPKIFTTPGTSS